MNPARRNQKHDAQKGFTWILTPGGLETVTSAKCRLCRSTMIGKRFPIYAENPMFKKPIHTHVCAECLPLLSEPVEPIVKPPASSIRLSPKELRLIAARGVKRQGHTSWKMLSRAADYIEALEAELAAKT